MNLNNFTKLINFIINKLDTIFKITNKNILNKKVENKKYVKTIRHQIKTKSRQKS